MAFYKNKINIQTIWEVSLKIIINILIIYIIIILLIGLGKTLFSIKVFLNMDHFALGFGRIVTDILTFLVIIELFRSFIEYFKAKRFRLHSMIDPFVIFVIRELIIILYTHEDIKWQNLIGFSFLVLSLGIVRTLAVLYSPDNEESS